MRADMIVISSGQAGVDRGALIAANRHGYPTGGWCVKGRLAEDGPLPDTYGLVESSSDRSEDQIRLNVECSDITIVLTDSLPPVGRSLVAVTHAESLGKPLAVTRPWPSGDAAREIELAKGLRRWISEINPSILHVTGPRDSVAPGIQLFSDRFFSKIFMSRSRCACGRKIPDAVWKIESVASGESPVKCSQCGLWIHSKDLD